MKIIGNGKKLTFVGRLLVTGTSAAIPNSFVIFNKTNFPLLVFSTDFDDLLNFDENTGVFEFLQRGFLNVKATINFDTTAQPTRFEVTPFVDSGLGFVALNARCSNITVLTCNQVVLAGSIKIEKGDKLRFDVRDSNNTAFFKTETLGNGSIVPAVIIDFDLHNR
jgi:hypothetical protein